MVEKSHPDGKLEYGKLCLVRHADVQKLLLCTAFLNKSANFPSSKRQFVHSFLTAFRTNPCPSVYKRPRVLPEYAWADLIM